MRRLILATTVGLLSSSALAQQTSQGTASTPDLSGMWAHVSCCGFEPPVAGPGPVTNRVRRNGAADLYQFVGDYTNPILKPEAARAVKEHGDIELTGMPAALPSNQCWPGGVPFVFWNIGIEIIQQPHQVTILYSNDRDFRQLR